MPTLIDKLCRQTLPIIASHQQRASHILDHDDQPLQELIDLTSDDAALSLAILSKANQLSKRPLSSLDTAINLLGRNQLSRLIAELPQLDNQSPSQNHYLQLLERQRHAAFQAAAWCRLNRQQRPQGFHEAVLLAGLGELAVCVYLPAEYQKILTHITHTQHASNAISHAILGMRFSDISLALAEHWQLPEDICQFLATDKPLHEKVQAAWLANELARHADLDWQSQSTHQCQNLLAEYLQVEADEAINLSHQIAAEAAQTGTISTAQAAAAKLIQLKPVAKAPNIVKLTRDQVPNTAMSNDQDKPAEKKPSSTLMQSIQQLRHDQLNPTEIIRILVQVLREGVNLERILFTKLQQRTLSCGACVGIEPNSPLRTLKLELRRQQLFFEIAHRPQAIWVNADNVSKYNPFIPGEFKQAMASDHYFCTAICLGTRTLGLLFADRNSKELDEKSYASFKQLCGLANDAFARIQPPNEAAAEARS